jgi:protein-L-isoaspartate(D-aspartate) O-methyltransferase
MGEAPTHGESEERAQFMLRMRARGVGDLRLLRALERAPRSLFMPQRYADIAARDIALPIGCGQTAPPPSIVAAMIETLDVQPGVRVLEIGGGTGYASALLAQMAGEILSLERCETLAVEAAERLAAFGVDNVEVVFADGLTYHPVRRTFDRILVHGLIEAPATRLIEMLTPEGALVGVMFDETASEQRIVRLAHAVDGGIAATAHGPARAFSPLVEGLARAF